MAKVFIEETTLTEIGDAIRTKRETTELIPVVDMASEILAIDQGSDIELPTLTNPGTAADVLAGKEVIGQAGNLITGTIATKTASNLTASGATVTVPAGYYASNTTKSVATATQATPSISINSSGLITASATQTAGYVSAGTKSGTKQLTTQAAKTITPSTSSQTAVAKNVYTTGAVTVGAIPSSYVKPTATKAATTYTPGTSNQTIAAGTYCSGAQTIKGDSKLVAGNIKSGVSIFGVAGSYTGDTGKTTLVINVETGSSVTISNSSTGASYTQTSANNQATFSNITLGTWTIKATKSGKTVTKTIEVTNPSTTLHYETIIYNNGSTITGGWTSIASAGSKPAVTNKTTNNVAWQRISVSGSGAYVTANPIDLTYYNTISFKGNENGRKSKIIIIKNDFTSWHKWEDYVILSESITNVDYDDVNSNPTANSTQTIDISHITGSYRIGFGMSPSDTAIIRMASFTLS